MQAMGGQPSRTLEHRMARSQHQRSQKTNIADRRRLVIDAIDHGYRGRRGGRSQFGVARNLLRQGLDQYYDHLGDLGVLELIILETKI